MLFIPFALTDQDEYAKTARGPFERWGFQLESIHETLNKEDPVLTVNNAEAIFVGGGNTFRLLKRENPKLSWSTTLQRRQLFDQSVAKKSMIHSLGI